MNWKVKIFAWYMRVTITQSGDELLTAEDAVEKTRNDYWALPSYDRRRDLATAPMKATRIKVAAVVNGSSTDNNGRFAVTR